MRWVRSEVRFEIILVVEEGGSRVGMRALELKDGKVGGGGWQGSGIWVPMVDLMDVSFEIEIRRDQIDRDPLTTLIKKVSLSHSHQRKRLRCIPG